MELQLLHPSSCLARAPHLVLWAYTDIMEVTSFPKFPQATIYIYIYSRAFAFCYSSSTEHFKLLCLADMRKWAPEFDFEFDSLLCLFSFQISKMYLILKFGVIFFVMGSVGVIPTFYDTVTTNSAVEVPKLCRFEQVCNFFSAFTFGRSKYSKFHY